MLQLTPAPPAPAILLFRGRGFLSWLIRWQTRGTYSHVAFLMPDGRIVESYPGAGVRVRHVSDWSDVDAFSIPGLHPEHWHAAITFAMREVGCGYDWWAIIRFISRRHMPENDKWFCSELVFEALQHAGLDLLQRIPADEVSPQMLSLSPLLEPVTPIQVRPRSSTTCPRTMKTLLVLLFSLLLLSLPCCSLLGGKSSPASTITTTKAPDGTVTTVTQSTPVNTAPDPVDQATADAIRSLFGTPPAR